jgi:hypothetical protein
MARDGSGNYSIPNTFVPSTTIASTAVNANFSDIATALTGSLARNSEGPMTAALVLHQNGFNYEVDPDTGIKRTAANEQAIFCGGANVVVVGTATVSIAIAVNIVGALAVGGAMTLGGTQTITGSSVGFVGQEIISTEAAAAVGPIHSLYRNSASPANADFIGAYDFYGNDSGANKTLFGRLTFQITDVTNGSEDADFFIQAMIGGTVTTVLRSSASQIQIPGSLAVTGVISASNIVRPTVQRFTAGAANYTPSAGVSHIRVRMCAGGGGGGGGTANNGTNGNTTSFGAWTCLGGTGGTGNSGSGGGAGGTGGADGTGTLINRVPGGKGCGSASGNSGMSNAGGHGGVNPFGGAGVGGALAAGSNGTANTGAGGAGGGGANVGPGSGGGAGEYVEFFVNSPGVIAYSVGAAANGGAAGTFAGGNGAAGVIFVEEFYI